MTRLALLVLCSVLLTSCTAGGALKLLTGGGPNVAANVQGGKTNVQSVGGTTVTDQKIIRPQARTIEQSSGDTRVKADRVETVVVNETPVWLIIALVVAVFLDSPLRWPGQIIDGFMLRYRNSDIE